MMTAMVVAAALGTGFTQLQTDLAGPGTVGLHSGQIWQGWLQGMEKDHLSVRRGDSAEGVILLLAANEIREVRLPGSNWQEIISQGLRDEDPEKRQTAIGLFAQYWDSRLPYLQWLSPVEWLFLAQHIPDLIHAGNNWQAMGYAHLLKQRLPESARTLLGGLDFALLEALHLADVRKAALNAARDLVERHQGYTPHGLPWYLLARKYAEQEQWEAALELLQTALFLSEGPDIPWMEAARALALELARRTRNRSLYNELVNNTTKGGKNGTE